jgi:hypothetical protein
MIGGGKTPDLVGQRACALGKHPASHLSYYSPLVASLPHSTYDLYYLYILPVYFTACRFILQAACVYISFDFGVLPPSTIPGPAASVRRYIRPFLLVRSIPPPLLFWSTYKHPRDPRTTNLRILWSQEDDSESTEICITTLALNR